MLKIDYADKSWLVVERVEIYSPRKMLLFFACIGLLIAGIPLLAIDIED